MNLICREEIRVSDIFIAQMVLPTLSLFSNISDIFLKHQLFYSDSNWIKGFFMQTEMNLDSMDMVNI